MFYLKARAKLLKTHFYQMGANINQTLFSAAFWCFRVSRLHFVFEIRETTVPEFIQHIYKPISATGGEREKNATHNLKFGVISKF